MAHVKFTNKNNGISEPVYMPLDKPISHVSARKGDDVSHGFRSAFLQECASTCALLAESPRLNDAFEEGLGISALLSAEAALPDGRPVCLQHLSLD
ncbi:MAG: hypothetical protein AAF530_23270 [Pseudomonadota bacterium]